MTATILIVDDSTFIVEGLVALLRKSYRAIPSYGGEECLIILRTEHPDVIVLDIMMEPMDGWETLARIKENPATRHIPVLMFSAKKISPDEAEAHRIRIDDFLTKPVNPRELVTAIEKILERENQKKKILYHWTRAGVPQEKTDEFLTISSNLDVDTSLLAAMKKQMEHPTTLPVRREELAVSISFLQERIEAGRIACGEFLRETGLTLPSPSDDTGPGAPAPADTLSDGIPMSASATGTVTSVHPDGEDSLPRETGHHEGGETAAGVGEEPASPPGSAGIGPEPDPVPPPVGGTSVQGDEPPGTDEPVATSISPEPGHEPSAGMQRDDTPPAVLPAREPVEMTASMSAEPGYESSAGMQRDDTPPAVPPAREPVEMTTPSTDCIESIHAFPPAGPDQAGESSGTGPFFRPGAVPAIQTGESLPARNAGTPVYRGPEGKAEPSRDAPPSRGFFSGIIAAIAGFFGRRKQ